MAITHIFESGVTSGYNVKNYASIQAAVTAAPVGSTLILPDDAYEINDSVIINKRLNVAFEPGAEVLITANKPAFEVQAHAVKFYYPTIKGTGKANGLTNQRGINFNGYHSFTVMDADISNMGGVGIYYKTTNVGSNRYGGRIVNPNCQNNLYGIFSDQSGEYVNIIGGTLRLNTTGVIVRGGNNTFSGTDINDNATGVLLEGSTKNAAYVNDGHGIFSGCNINHNTSYNVYADGITLGETFSGCHLYDSKIYLKNTKGIAFIGCQLAPISMFFEGSLGTQFLNNTIYTGYGFAVNKNYNGTTSSEVQANNYAYDGTPVTI